MKYIEKAKFALKNLNLTTRQKRELFYLSTGVEPKADLRKVDIIYALHELIEKIADMECELSVYRSQTKCMSEELDACKTQLTSVQNDNEMLRAHAHNQSVLIAYKDEEIKGLHEDVSLLVHSKTSLFVMSKEKFYHIFSAIIVRGCRYFGLSVRMLFLYVYKYMSGKKDCVAGISNLGNVIVNVKRAVVQNTDMVVENGASYIDKQYNTIKPQGQNGKL